MHRGSWMVPMVPDDCKGDIADDLQTCIHTALGFVCDGVQATILCWEFIFGNSRFRIVLDTFQFGLQVFPCREFDQDHVRQR